MTLPSRSILIIVVALVFMWIGAFLTYMQQVQIPGREPTEKAGGIVILTGTPARLNAGFHLLKSGAGSRLLVSGVNAKVTRETLRQATGQSEELMNCCVDLGRIAQNTVGNAVETARWATSNEFGRLLIVTSAYHMPRSLVELKRRLPDATLLPYPVESTTLDLQKWWTSANTMLIVSGEFNKYLFSLVRAHFEEADTSKGAA